MSKKDITIAIVSDLHCRHGKEEQITTHLYTETARNPKSHHPVESLKDLILQDSLNADILLCPGDLADKADEQGLQSGWEFLKEIAISFKCKLCTTSVGNHDVNSRNLGGKEAYEYLVSFKDDYPGVHQVLRSNYFSRTKNFYIYEDKDTILLNFNSAFNHTDKIKAGESVIPQTIQEEIDRELKNLPNDDRFRIALFHHHPTAYSNVDPAYKDGDVIQRGEELLKVLQHHNFDIVIHGHKHIPRLEYFNSTLPLFCAGSFSSLMNLKDISGKNTFHLLALSKSNGKTHGLIKTWEFTKGHGWNRANNELFFPWITGFGSNNSLAVIEHSVSQIVTATTIVKYDDLLSQVVDLQYLTPIEQDLLTANLLTKHNIEFVPKLKSGAKFVSKQSI